MWILKHLINDAIIVNKMFTRFLIMFMRFKTKNKIMGQSVFFVYWNWVNWVDFQWVYYERGVKVWIVIVFNLSRCV